MNKEQVAYVMLEGPARFVDGYWFIGGTKITPDLIVPTLPDWSSAPDDAVWASYADDGGEWVFTSDESWIDRIKLKEGIKRDWIKRPETPKPKPRSKFEVGDVVFNKVGDEFKVEISQPDQHGVIALSSNGLFYSLQFQSELTKKQTDVEKFRKKFPTILMMREDKVISSIIKWCKEL